MERKPIFGFPTVLVLDAGDCEIRVEDWVIVPDDPVSYRQHELNFAAIARAIQEHELRGGC